MSLLTATISAFAHALPATRANRLLILIYHRVHRRPDPMFSDEADAARFDWQMSLIRQYCHPVTLLDGVDGLKHGGLPPRAVCVTFDDGYADNATVALPILRRHGIPATFFIATGFLNGGRMWNDTIIEAIRHAAGPTLDLTELGLGSLRLGDEASRGPMAERILRAVKHLHPTERLERAEAIARRSGTGLPTDLMMSSQQVRQLANSGMDVGAHTLSHPILRVLSEDEARAEVRGSQQALEQIIGRPVRTFAYPNGRLGFDYTARDRDLVAELGFELAVSTHAGVATPASDLLQLPRFTPWDRSPERWLARLLYAFGRTA